jgi:uncharacterized protein (UPF0297 family)
MPQVTGQNSSMLIAIDVGLFLESTVIHIWRAVSTVAYIPDPDLGGPKKDKLASYSYLERDGVLITGVVWANLKIYDAGTLIKEFMVPNEPFHPKANYDNPTPPNASGTYEFIWDDTTLEAGKVYTTTTTMQIATGGSFTSPSSFEVTASKVLQEVQATVNYVLDKPISAVSNEINIKLDDQIDLIDTKMDAQTAVIVEKTQEMKETVENVMKSFEEKTYTAIEDLQKGATQAVEAGEALTATAQKYSWKAVSSPNPALAMDSITIQCQGPPGKYPVLTIYSWNDIRILSVTMSETSDGLYTYGFVADARFTPGKAYTYTITEPDTGGLVSGSGMVESISLTTVAGLAAAAPEAERAAKKALDAIKAVEAVLISGESINIALTLKNLKESVEALPETLKKEGANEKAVQVMNEIADKLKVLFGGEDEQGYNIKDMIGEALAGDSTLKAVRDKTENINAVIDLLMQLFENKFGGKDSPVSTVAMTSGSVKFKLMTINPSKTKMQKVQLKTYLPEEVKPKDILDLGGMDLEYDTEKSIYYVYKNVELAPSEARAYEVEVEDIWFIAQKESDELSARVDSILARLEDTQYYTSAKEIADTIYPKLKEIIVSQKDDSISRQQHIGIYRQNLLVVKQIKDDIARMEKILVTAGGPASPEMLAKTKIKADEPSKTMTWVVIFVIIIFIGLLAAALFFTWQRQAKFTRDEIAAAKKSAFPEEEASSKKEGEKAKGYW